MEKKSRLTCCVLVVLSGKLSRRLAGAGRMTRPVRTRRGGTCAGSKLSPSRTRWVISGHMETYMYLVSMALLPGLVDSCPASMGQVHVLSRLVVDQPLKGLRLR